MSDENNETVDEPVSDTSETPEVEEATVDVSDTSEAPDAEETPAAEEVSDTVPVSDTVSPLQLRRSRDVRGAAVPLDELLDELVRVVVRDLPRRRLHQI